jgi:hypothetical protein
MQYIIYKQALQWTISIMSDQKVSKMMLQCSNSTVLASSYIDEQPGQASELHLENLGN